MPGRDVTDAVPSCERRVPRGPPPPPVRDKSNASLAVNSLFTQIYMVHCLQRRGPHDARTTSPHATAQLAPRQPNRRPLQPLHTNTLDTHTPSNSSILHHDFGPPQLLAAADARGAALLAAAAGQPAASHGAPRQPAAARSPPSLSTVFRSSSPQPGLTPAPNSSLQLQPLKVHAPSSCTSASKLAHAKDDAVRRTRATQAAAAPDARAGTSFSTRRVRAK